MSVAKFNTQEDGFGIMYTTNGDQIFWQTSSEGIVFSGGTGRFKNVSGGYKFAEEPVAGEPYIGPNGKLTIPYLPYKGEGTITY